MTDEDYPSMFNTINFSSFILLVQYFLALFYALLFLNLAYQITNRSKMFHTLTYTHALLIHNSYVHTSNEEDYFINIELIITMRLKFYNFRFFHFVV